MAAFTSPAGAQCTGTDSFEDNDDCASATVITSGLYTGLSCQGPLAPGGVDYDFYRVSLNPGERLDVSIYFTHTASRDLDLLLIDPNAVPCNIGNGVLGQGFSASDNERLMRTNVTAAPVDILIAVIPGSTGGVICNTYDLDVFIGPDPCLQIAAVDDAFEDNDLCTTAAAMIGNGAWTNLFVAATDFDHYRVNVPAGEIFSAQIDYDEQVSELQLELFDDLLCQSLVDSSSFGGHDDVAWKNTTGTAQDVIVAVSTQPGASCSFYDMQFVVTPDPCVVGQNDPYAPNGTCATAAVLTPGLITGLFVDGPTADYFKVTVPGTHLLNVDLQFVDGTNGLLGIRLYDGNPCSNVVDQAAWSDEHFVTTGAAFGVTRDYYINVYPLGIPTDCNGYELRIDVVPDPCVTAADDVLEPNDTCAGAAVLTSGIYSSLFVSASDPDYYRVTLQPGERLIGEISSPTTNAASLHVIPMDVTCTTTLDTGGSHTEWANSGATPLDIRLVVETTDTSNGGCAGYDLFLSVVIDNCLATSDDGFEPNEDCTSAPTLSTGLVTGLFVHELDPDYYRVNLGVGDQINVAMNYATTSANVRLRLYEALPQTGGFCGDGTHSVATGLGSNGSKQFSWTNNIIAGDFFIEVVISPYGYDDCTTYELDIFETGLPLATPFCFGSGLADAGNGPVSCPCGNNTPVNAFEGCMNSQGHGATLEATGSASIAQNNLRFHIAQARPSQPSMLVQGATRIAVPFKDAVLCAGNPTERVEVVLLDAAGQGATSGPIATKGHVVPGDTRYYQQWYRDPQVSQCGTGSNLSHALQVDWVL